MPGILLEDIVGFEIGFIVHCLHFVDPVPKIGKPYFFLPTKINEVEDIKRAGASFACIWIKIEKNHVEP